MLDGSEERDYWVGGLNACAASGGVHGDVGCPPEGTLCIRRAKPPGCHCVAPPAGIHIRQFCAQTGARPSVCIQTRTQALPNTNIYLRFTVLENLVNNVNDESPCLAENIVQAASLKFSLSCTLGNTHAI